MPSTRFSRARTTALVGLVLAALSAPLARAQVTGPVVDPSRMPPPGWPSSPKQYEAIKVATDLMIPTRDGKRMATDIYRPGKNGVPLTEKLPVLLNRTPYGKASLAEQAEFYAERGYVVALQDTRGRYKSEGDFSKVQPKDATDGYDVIAFRAYPCATGLCQSIDQPAARHGAACTGLSDECSNLSVQALFAVAYETAVPMEG